ncbi:MAG TPA: transaldolase family protein [archaeon]|nr:transaldolase family protein [archaeon]
MQRGPQLYLDSAVLNEVQQAHATGRLAGVTINPSLALRAIGINGDYADHVAKIYDIVGPKCHKSYQVIGKTRDEMLRVTDKLIKSFEQYGGLGIKVGILTATPDEKRLAREGLETVRALAQQGILVNVTTVQRPEHFVLSAHLGAGLVSPFLGRTDDLIRAYMGLRSETDFKKTDYFPADGTKPFDDGYGNVSGVNMMARGIYAMRLLKTPHTARTLAASIRNKEQTQEAYREGADILTSSSDTFMETAGSDFHWHEQSALTFNDITGQDVERWLEIYENGSPEEVYALLFHPKTVEGFVKFAEDGERLVSFKRLVSQ